MGKWSKYWLFSLPSLRELVPHNFGGFLSVFSSLGSRNFALYFFGQITSLCGSWIQFVAMGWLISSHLKGSVFTLTAMAFLNQIPNLVFTPFAGVLSDRFNRYRIMVTTQALFMCLALIVAALVLTDTVRLWHIMILSFCSGTVGAIEAPARQSFYTKLVPKEDMPNAIALNSVTINGSRFIGPAIGGILIGIVGVGYCFLINAASYIAVLIALGMMRLEPFVSRKTKIDVIGELREGFLYVKGFLPLKTVIVFVATVSFFAMPFQAVLPALVKETFAGDSKLYGYMLSCFGGGAVTAALYLASRRHVLGLGKVVTIDGVLIGICMIGISLTRTPLVACILSIPFGFAAIGSMASCNTLLQSMVEDNKRGRVMSFFTMAFAGMAPIGGLLYGWCARHTSLPATIFVAGTVCLAAACVYEYFRPKVRAAAHERYVSRKGEVNPGIAAGIGEGFRNPF